MEVYMIENVLFSILIVILVAVLFLLAFILARTIQYGKPPQGVQPVELDEVDGAVVAEHLATAIRFRTISGQDRAKIDPQPFLDMQAELKRLYPRVHSTLQLEMVNRHSLLYTWKGRDPNLEGVLFAGHIDVVPVDPVSKDEWKQAPFGGFIGGGYVWGRGALDVKCMVISPLEAVEHLLRKGFQPERTIYLAFGHDEEIGGSQGAAQMAGRLLSQGVRLAAVLDEGGSIVERGMVPGVGLPVALIGVAEKGYLSLEMEVEGKGGHSSMPPKHTAIGVLAQAIIRLEDHPMPVNPEMVYGMFRSLGGYLSFGLRMAFANTWLLGKTIQNKMAAKPSTNAMMRTTSAVTLIHGGVKDNILPSQVRAVVNYRLMPGDRIADVVAHARKAIDNEAIQLHIPEVSRWEASPISPMGAEPFQDILTAIGEVFPEVAAAPYLVVGATDSRHYASVCENIYRFSPYLMTDEDLKTVHGSNERISVEGLVKMVQFYIRLIDRWAGHPKP
jgi:carboxypeptidase PM20D1